MLPQEGPAVALTVMLRLPLAESGVGALESVTFTVKVVVPAVVGVPLMVPAEERANPAGREVPFPRRKVKGATPTPAINVAE
jgi:hypothetical protein